MVLLPNKTQLLLNDIISRQSLGGTYLFFGETDAPLQEAGLYLVRKWRELVDQTAISSDSLTDPENNITDFYFHKEESASIKINTIREIQEKIKYGPLHQSKYFVVIANCEKFTKESANAFLKTLEEPPENTCFILLSESVQSLPKTIASRSLQLFIPNSHSNKTSSVYSFKSVLQRSLFEKLQLSQEFHMNKEAIDKLIYTWIEEINLSGDESLLHHIPTLLNHLRNAQFNTNKRLQFDALLSSLE